MNRQERCCLKTTKSMQGMPGENYSLLSLKKKKVCKLFPTMNKSAGPGDNISHLHIVLYHVAKKVNKSKTNFVNSLDYISFSSSLISQISLGT